MRTTVTLEKDVERLLRDEMHRKRQSFKETINDAIRAGLSPTQTTPRPPVTIKARPLGLRSGLDPAGLKRTADDWEVDAFIEKTRRLEQR